MRSQRTEAVEVALAPEELGKLSEDQLKKRYEKAIAEQQAQQPLPQSASSSSSNKRKERDRDDDADRKSKKKRDFKF